MKNIRLRDLGVSIGTFPTGSFNAITDVSDVWVGQTTIIQDIPRIARTGVTAILPCKGEIWNKPIFAGFHSYNGCGEMTGTHWIAESGMLTSPILLTNTAQVGVVHQALGQYAFEHGYTSDFELPVVAETFDGWLSDMTALHVKPEHVFQAMESAKPGKVQEGCVGGGTGMICHEFKGGIGTASRVLDLQGTSYTIGALVQANYGMREDLRLDGTAIGKEIPYRLVSSSFKEMPGEGSIIIIIATDAPLLPFQCNRLAQRAAAGLARTGGFGFNGSGDLILAFATGNKPFGEKSSQISLRMVQNHEINPFFKATAEAVEESIWNALIAAETTTGFKNRTAYAIPHEEVIRIWKKYKTNA